MHIKPRTLSVSCILAACAVLSFSPEAFAAQPNIVFIISDDHDNEHLGFMGNEIVHTPNLDRLANSGTVFSVAHLPMSRCHPTLASFLSGRWPHQSGIYYNYGTKKLSTSNSLPGQLKKAGYATYVEGKYWEGDPREMGFTHGKGKTARTFVRKGQDDLFSFIDEVGGKKPLFIWWAPLIPHTPHNPPKKYRELFTDVKIPVPAHVSAGNEEIFLRKERLSFAMEAWLDDGVGQLEKKLKEKGLYENTLFVFLIDNGWCNGRPSKGSPFEKGVRTPVFFTWPGKIKGAQRFSCLTSTLDVFPTILDYAEAVIPEGIAGKSLRPIIDGKTQENREILFGAIYPAFATKDDQRPERDIYAIYARDERWKYILYLQDVRASRSGKYFRIQSIATEFPARKKGDEDLYDLDADPWEMRDLSALVSSDLAQEPDHAGRMKKMRALAIKWWKDTGGKEFDTRPPSADEQKPSSRGGKKNKRAKKQGKKTAAEPGSTSKPKQVLSRHVTVATFKGKEYRLCRGRTSRCPKTCGQSGEFAVFSIEGYIEYEKPGKYGDPMKKTFRFQVSDFDRKPLEGSPGARTVSSMKAGDYARLEWNHEYDGSMPSRPLRVVRSIGKAEALELIAKSRKAGE
jgi:arylsulfatase A-like enzyme